MRLSLALRAAPIALALLTTAVFARPGERDHLNACKAMVDHAAQPQAAGSPAPDEAQLQQCRQIIKEWILRDSRMSVDENGRPLK
jgi:hypothetical protein